MTLTDISHFGFTSISRISLPLEEEIENFDSVLQNMVTVPVVTPILLQSPVTTLVRDKVGNVTGTFETELLSMSLSTGAVMIRESLTLVLTGLGAQELAGGRRSRARAEG